MYLPWMILTGYEVAGNFVIAVIFLTCPGIQTSIGLIWIY